jgi:hypothetical protein
MPVERREQVRLRQRETGGTHCLDGKRQPLLGGTIRMNREVHVRISDGLGVQFLGPTRRLPGLLARRGRHLRLRTADRIF